MLSYRHCLLAPLVIAIAACGKSGSTADQGSAAPRRAPAAAKDAAPAVPEVIVPMAYRTEDLDAQIHADAGAALVARSGGKCKEARSKAIYSAVVDDAGGHLIGIDCGERGAQLIGLVRHDGKDATVLAAAHVRSGSVRVDRILASEKRLCLQYNQVDGIRITKNLRHCFAKAGDSELPTVVPPPNPTAALPAWEAPAGLIAAAKAQVYEEIQTCQNAQQRPPEVTYAVMHGERRWIAVSCGDLAQPSNGLALFEVRDGKPALVAYSLDADTTTIEMEGIRASDRLACMDYKQQPSGNETELCFAIY